MGKAIKLGREVPDYENAQLTAGGMDAPSPEKMSEKDMPKRMAYPSAYIHDAPPEMGVIPDEGFAIIRYKVRERTVSSRGDEKSARLEIDMMSFEPCKGKKGESTKEHGELSEKDADSAFEEFFKED